MPNNEFFFDPDESSSSSHPARQQAEYELSDSGVKLLGDLPDTVRPMETATRFPHIVNRFAKFWSSPKIAERYFDELLMDSRGGRQGFPLGVLTELFSLKEYYLTKVHPKPPSLWDDAFLYHSRDRS